MDDSDAIHDALLCCCSIFNILHLMCDPSFARDGDEGNWLLPNFRELHASVSWNNRRASSRNLIRDLEICPPHIQIWRLCFGSLSLLTFISLFRHPNSELRVCLLPTYLETSPQFWRLAFMRRPSFAIALAKLSPNFREAIIVVLCLSAFPARN